MMLPRPVARALTVLLAACLLAAGCCTANPHKAGGAPARAAWQQVLGELSPDGTASAATALKAFALAFGPLPGVRVPSGRTTTHRRG